MAINRDNLGYLGIDFQYKLVKAFVDDHKFFSGIVSIINQNMFTESHLRTFVGVMKEYYQKHELVPSLSMIEILLRTKANSEIDIEHYQAIINKIKTESSEGVEKTKELSDKFFRQQNFIRISKEILKIAERGEHNDYDLISDLVEELKRTDDDDDLGVSVFDNLDEVLSDDYRVVIPTGIGKIDDTLEGGIGKGELGLIIGPSSFGKALSVNELVCTPNGFVRNGDLKIGDYVTGSDGGKTKVIGVFPQGKRDIYTVSFSDGVQCDCDLEHLWAIKNTSTNKNSVISLKEIVESGLIDNNGNLKFEIPLTKQVIFKQNSVQNRVEELESVIMKNCYVDEDGDFTVQFFDKKRFDYFRDLILSLGGFCHCKGELLMSINFNIDIIPKFDNQIFIDLFKGGKQKHRFISNVTFKTNEDAQCIKVSASDELYLTRDYIVTHNTSMTTAMSCHAAQYRCDKNNNEGFKVLQFIFEDRPKQIQRKYLGRLTGVESKDLSKKEYIDSVKETLNFFEDKETINKNIKIKRYPSGEVNLDILKKHIKKQINSGFKADLIIIDYFECLDYEKSKSSNESEWNVEGRTMRKIESMAAEFDAAVWVTTQGNKDSLNGELVTMGKSGGSVKKIQVAHIIMSIARTNEDINRNKATIAILKNRAGMAGKIFNDVEFNNGTCIISTDNIIDFDDAMNAHDLARNNGVDKNKIALQTFKTYEK